MLATLHFATIAGTDGPCASEKRKRKNDAQNATVSVASSEMTDLLL